MSSPTHTPADSAAPAKSFTRFFPHIARVLMGLLFAFASIAFFFNLVPPPKDPMPEKAAALMGGFAASGYLLQFIKGTELLVAALLLLNRWVPLALVILAPIVLNIVAIHAILLPAGLPTALVVLALELYLAWAYRAAFRPLLQARHAPA